MRLELSLGPHTAYMSTSVPRAFEKARAHAGTELLGPRRIRSLEHARSAPNHTGRPLAMRVIRSFTH